MFKSYTFTAPKSGQNILILGAVHGNEIAGTLAQKHIIQQINTGEIKLKSGSVTFIPVVNEAAQKQDVRFIDVNLNRVVCHHDMPQNNEEKIANVLIKAIDACDIMLDLHSTHCPQDVEFAFIDYPTPQNKELLSLIPVKTVLSGWPAIYANNPDIANFSTEEYAHTHNKCGITVECGYHKAPQAVSVATQSILNVLTHHGVIEGDLPVPLMPHLITLDSYIVKQSTGHFVRDFQHLDTVKTGETIALYDTGKTLSAPFDGYIIMPNPTADIGAEWFYFGRENDQTTNG